MLVMGAAWAMVMGAICDDNLLPPSSANILFKFCFFATVEHTFTVIRKSSGSLNGINVHKWN
jgi:hypothetical protein